MYSVNTKRYVDININILYIYIYIYTYLSVYLYIHTLTELPIKLGYQPWLCVKEMGDTFKRKEDHVYGVGRR